MNKYILPSIALFSLVLLWLELRKPIKIERIETAVEPLPVADWSPLVAAEGKGTAVSWYSEPIA